MRGEDTDGTRSHCRPGAQLWVGRSRNWLVFLEWPLLGPPRDRSCALSMQPVDGTQCCSTDAVVVNADICQLKVINGNTILNYRKYNGHQLQRERERNTNANNLVVSPTSEGGQIHLNPAAI